MRRALEEAGYAVHGAGAVERDDGGDVLNALGLEARAHGGYARALELEHALRPARGEHGEGLLVVLRHRGYVKARLTPAHHLRRVLEHGEVAKAEEVHLQKAQVLQRRHRVLRDDALVVAREGDVLVHRPLGYDDARSVGGGVARHALERLGRVDERVQLLVARVHLPQRL